MTMLSSVHQGSAIEIVSFDPRQGAIFYLLDERKLDKPAFQRAELDCTQCHIAAGTRGVPGVLLRSVFPTQTGTLTPRAPSYITDQESPWKQRFGGWYVSGELSKLSMGNSAVTEVPAPDAPRVAAATPTLNPLTEPFDPAAYLAPGSDPVALLVLTHQTQMHNLITLTNYQTRLAPSLAKNPGAYRRVQWRYLDAGCAAGRARRRSETGRPVRYLLFAGETPLGGLNANRSSRHPFARISRAG